MSRQKLVLVGGGGHCRSAIEVIESSNRYDIVSLLDLPEKIGKTVIQYIINGTEEDFAKLVKEGNHFTITIGHIRNALPRKQVFEKIRKAEAVLPVISSPFSVVSHSSSIGEGTMIFHKAVINSCSVIGKNNIINTGAIIEHDTVIGDHCHISTGAIVNGGCQIGSMCFIGSGAVIKEGVYICDEVIIGAGSLVTRSIFEKGLYYGSPSAKKD